jgi:hypothetical protein
VIAYKFLAAGARGPLTRVVWPAIGGWLVTDEPIAVGLRGVHACLGEQLAHWIHDELWQVELAGALIDGPDCVVAERARLVRRIDGWNPEGAIAFASACVDRARREATGRDELLGDASEAIRHGYPAVAAYTAAIAIAADDEASYARERAWQSAWIVREFIATSPKPDRL